MDKFIIALLVVSFIAFFIYLVSMVIQNMIEARKMDREIELLTWGFDNFDAVTEHLVSEGIDPVEILNMPKDEYIGLLEEVREQ